jgi:hypothetical protein
MDEPKMTRDDIIRMAGESWLTEYGVKELSFGRDVEIDIEALDQFAALVAAAEREACAKVCDKYAGPFNAHRIGECADAIRERGQA